MFDSAPLGAQGLVDAAGDQGLLTPTTMSGSDPASAIDTSDAQGNLVREHILYTPQALKYNP